MKKNYVVYHSVDFDGIGSGAIAGMHLKNVQYVPWTYGDGIPDFEENTNIYLLDLSFPPCVMGKLMETNKLIWIDHHISAIKNMLAVNLNPKGLRDIKFSAIALTYKFFNPHSELPIGIKLLSDYDRWIFEDERTLPFQFFMRGFNPDVTDIIWKHLTVFSESEIQKYVNEGEQILSYQKEQDKRNCHNMQFRTFNMGVYKYDIGIINGQYCNSDVYKTHAKNNGADFIVSWVLRSNNVVTVSLYAVNDIDVSVIAKQYDGGGHAGASGFQTTIPELMELFY